MTPATSATVRSFGWKSVRCFCRAASAVSASSAGGSDRAAAVAMSLRPKEAEMASTRWRCNIFAETFRFRSTAKSAVRSPSLSGLKRSTHRTTFDNARNPRSALPNSSTAAAKSLNGRRSGLPPRGPAAAGSKAGEPKSSGLAPASTAQAARAASTRCSQVSASSTSSASASSACGSSASASSAGGSTGAGTLAASDALAGSTSRGFLLFWSGDEAAVAQGSLARLGVVTAPSPARLLAPRGAMALRLSKSKRRVG
mmetsp:Transcript_1986/g.6613  ORF Transcript_1986/g.6613 Transcript_1986/m.6613 type:complete len:256 (-) Transcript_1986:11-778(-)